MYNEYIFTFVESLIEYYKCKQKWSHKSTAIVYFLNSAFIV
jgi:hypothetical protein